MEPVEISAGSLHLRPFAERDADRVFAICQDPEIQRWTQVPSPYTTADAYEFVSRIVPMGWQTGAEAIFAVCDSTAGEVLASIGLHLDRSGDEQMAEIGYLCAAEARGRGVTTAGVAAVCRWGFDALDLGRIEWLAEVGNVASHRVAEKVGFVMEGTARARLLHRGERKDAWVAALLPGDVSDVGPVTPRKPD
jgi:RimJ/RimL family protein N-acetyltransferase